MTQRLRDLCWRSDTHRGSGNGESAPRAKTTRHLTSLLLLLGLDLLLSGSRATAQHALRFDNVIAEDGLSGPEVWEVHQDAEGFMWFSTGEALDRYDGYTIKSYRSDPGKADSLSHNFVSVLLADSGGRLWAGTVGGGLNLYLPTEDAFAHFRHRPEDLTSLNSDLILSLLEDRDGSLWVGTDSGLHRLTPPVGGQAQLDARRQLTGTESFVRAGRDPDSGPAVHALYQGSDGTLWVGAGALGIYEPDSGHIRYVVQVSASTATPDPEDSGDGTITAIQEDAAGHLWLASTHGLIRLDPATGAVERFRHDPLDDRSLSSDRVEDLLVDRQGTLWVATHSGLDVYEPSRGSFRHHVHDVADLHSLGVTPINGLFEDRTGVIWIGTSSGASRWHPGRAAFHTYRRQTGREPTLASSDLWSVEEDRSGALWLALGLNGLDRLDRATGAVDHYVHDPAVPDSLPSGQIATVYEDRRGDLWVGSRQGGLSRFDPQRSRFVHFRHDATTPSTVSSDDVQRFFEDSAGRFWIGAAPGLNLLDRETGRFTRLPVAASDPAALGYASFIAMVEDDDRSLWFASLDHGLFHLRHGDETFQAVETGDQKEVISLLADAEDLWLGTASGLMLLNRRSQKVLRHYGLSDGLPSTTIRGIQRDNQGYLWISSNRGLSRFDPNAETFRNFDLQDGLQGASFSTKADLVSPSGEMFFGGWHGLTSFFPDHIRDDPHPPSVVLTDFRLFNRKVLPRGVDPESPLETSLRETEEVVLSHRQYVFGFEIAALHFAAPGKNRYAYRLEGLDRDWIPADASQRFVQYTGLRPGSYTFRAKASNKDGVWNEDGVRLRIRILPPPWRSAWAYGAYASALLALVGLYLRAQATKLRRERRAAEQERAIAERERAVSRRLQAVDKLKDEFLANTSHELRTPLYGITGLAESLIDGAAGDVSPAMRDNLLMIVGSGRRLSHLVNDILDFSKLRHESLELDLRPVDLKPLVEVVLTLSRPLVGAKELELINAVPSDLPAADADENRLQQILYNLIGNAVKFTESGSVEVSASAEDDMLRVRVTDTGIGIPQAHQERIFDAFEQADASAERAHGGTGLGLTVTRKLVELHGGKISLDSAPDHGSIFSFSLPIAADAMTDTAPLAASAHASPILEDLRLSAAARAEPAEGAAGGFCILIVDDEPVIRQVLVNQLATQGYRLLQAASGREALARVEEQTPDLILLDVMMPRLSGYEVCRTLRQRHSLEELPVIFLTAKSQPSDLVVGLAAGANDYLPKPISKLELLARVKTHLDLLDVHRQLSSLVDERTSQLREREQLVAERERLIDQLENRNAELARFNYTVAHDLKNPMTTIKNFIGLVGRDAAAGDHERLHKDLERVDKAADHLKRLLDELFEFSRIERSPGTCVEIPLDELVREVLHELADVLAGSGVTVDVAPGLPIVCGDRDHMLEMVRHLLHNAVRYLGAQPTPRVEIGVRDTEAGPVVTIRDNGIGIATEYQERIFNLFERLDPEASEGSGVGLALVRRIVEVHGGQIWVESEGPGMGSTFCLSLPIGECC